jgi:hypothetical protein
MRHFLLASYPCLLWVSAVHKLMSALPPKAGIGPVAARKTN